MKVALLLPGYLDSPDYLHMKVFEKRLHEMGYAVERLDPCHLWETDNVNDYSITNYLKQVTERVHPYAGKNPDEIVLIGHSLGAFVAIIAGNRNEKVTQIVALCSAPDRIGQNLHWNGKEFRHSERELPDNPQEIRTFDIPKAFAEDGLQYSAAEEVKQIHKPLMLFIALEDKSVPPEETERIVANANNPHVVRQPGMGHDFRMSQEQSELVMKEIEKFLFTSV